MEKGGRATSTVDGVRWEGAGGHYSNINLQALTVGPQRQIIWMLDVWFETEEKIDLSLSLWNQVGMWRSDGHKMYEKHLVVQIFPLSAAFHCLSPGWLKGWTQHPRPHWDQSLSVLYWRAAPLWESRDEWQDSLVKARNIWFGFFLPLQDHIIPLSLISWWLTLVEFFYEEMKRGVSFRISGRKSTVGFG